MIKNFLLYKNTQTSLIFGLVGTTFGLYNSINSYDNYINKNPTNTIQANKIYNFKIITHPLLYGTSFAFLGYFPIITTPIITAAFIYDKYYY
jgi:hypothetical protein